MICKNCFADNKQFQTTSELPDSVICPECAGWMFVGEIPQSLSEVYDESYYEGSEYLSYRKGKEIYAKNFRRKINLLQKICGGILADKSILEVGCASGDFMEELQKAGVKKIMGLEISEYSLEEAKKKNLSVFSPIEAGIENKIKEFNPDIILAWDVWEHLPEPATYFKKIIDSAKDGAFFALTTVDCGALVPSLRKGKWRQFHPPSHLNYPTKKSFALFSKRTGLKHVYEGSFGYTRPLADYLGLTKELKKYFSQTKIFFKIPLYLNLHDIQLQIFQK